MTDSTGRIVAAWKTRDAFEIWQGEAGALVFVYSLQERRAVDAQNWLNAAGYTEFLACGLINGQRSEWIFTKPAESEACKFIFRDAASDPEFLRYFGDFTAVGPNGQKFGQANTFFVHGHEAG